MDCERVPTAEQLVGLLSEADLALALEVSPETLREYRRLGLPSYKVGHRFYYDRDEFRAFTRQRATAEEE